MTSRNLLRTLRPALMAVAAAAFTACSSDDVSPLAGNPSGPDLSVGFEVSSSRVPVGQQFAVAVVAESPVVLGDLQGYVRFDPRTMAYIGQAPEGRTMVTVNSSRASVGELRVLSLNVENGLPRRTGTLVFQVLKPGYTDGLKYQFETAGDKGTTMTISRAKTGYMAEAADLVVPTGCIPGSSRRRTGSRPTRPASTCWT
jgi:hypothetical protein